MIICFPRHQMIQNWKYILSPVTEITEKKTIQIKLPTSKVDTSNLKFFTSNLIPAIHKTRPEFTASLNCKGLVGKVDDTVTHIIEQAFGYCIGVKRILLLRTLNSIFTETSCSVYRGVFGLALFNFGTLNLLHL